MTHKVHMAKNDHSRGVPYIDAQGILHNFPVHFVTGRSYAAFEQAYAARRATNHPRIPSSTQLELAKGTSYAAFEEKYHERHPSRITRENVKFALDEIIKPAGKGLYSVGKDVTKGLLHYAGKVIRGLFDMYKETRVLNDERNKIFAGMPKAIVDAVEKNQAETKGLEGRVQETKQTQQGTTMYSTPIGPQLAQTTPMEDIQYEGKEKVQEGIAEMLAKQRKTQGELEEVLTEEETEIRAETMYTEPIGPKENTPMYTEEAITTMKQVLSDTYKKTVSKHEQLDELRINLREEGLYLGKGFEKEIPGRNKGRTITERTNYLLESLNRLELTELSAVIEQYTNKQTTKKMSTHATWASGWYGENQTLTIAKGNDEREIKNFTKKGPKRPFNTEENGGFIGQRTPEMRIRELYYTHDRTSQELGELIGLVEQQTRTKVENAFWTSTSGKQIKAGPFHYLKMMAPYVLDGKQVGDE